MLFLSFSIFCSHSPPLEKKTNIYSIRLIKRLNEKMALCSKYWIWCSCSYIWLHICHSHQSGFSSRGRPTYPLLPSDYHLGVAQSLFLSLMNWYTNEGKFQGSLDMCCTLSSPASWGLWIKCPVSHQALGTSGFPSLLPCHHIPQHYWLTEKSCT